MWISRISSLPKRLSFKIPAQYQSFRLAASNTSVSTTSVSTKPKDEEDVDAPIKYTASAASVWQARATRMGHKDTRLWYEPYVILASLSIFMIYFTMLREENDVDEELTKSLYSRIPGLEEHQLRIVLQYNQDHNLETDSIIKRLKELEDAKT